MQRICQQLKPFEKIRAKHLRHFRSSNKPKDNRSNTIKEAENIVGYSTSFLNLRWLLNDEIANIALCIKKTADTEHPLLKIAKDVLQNSYNPSWGLIVLLVSKAGGLKKYFMSMDQDVAIGILHSQRVLAEVTEMIRTGYLVHNGIVNVNDKNEHYGNKIALLSGDYLLSKSFSGLSSLNNQKVNYIMSTAIRDFSESAFLACRQTSFLYPLPCKPLVKQERSPYCRKFSNADNVDYGPYKIDNILGFPREEWILRTVLTSGNLLGKSCRAALLLGGHNKEAQRNAYLLGKHLAVTWQAYIDYEEFLEGKVNLLGAPVMLSMEQKPEVYNELENCYEKDHVPKIIGDIVDQCDALHKTKQLQEEYSLRTISNLEYFSNCSARESLRKLILALK